MRKILCVLSKLILLLFFFLQNKKAGFNFFFHHLALQQLPLHLRAVAVDCMSFEASSCVEDPVYGSVRIISQLQEQIIEAQSELAVKIKGEIAFLNAQQQLQQQQM